MSKTGEKGKKPQERRRTARSDDIARKVLEDIKAHKGKNETAPKGNDAK